MAYASQARPGSAANPKGIPANSILVFDVQLLSFKHPVPTVPVQIKKDSLPTPAPLKTKE